MILFRLFDAKMILAVADEMEKIERERSVVGMIEEIRREFPDVSEQVIDQLGNAFPNLSAAAKVISELFD